MWIKGLFQEPSPKELAQRELEKARRDLLAAQSAREYADAIVEYNTQRINRLSKYVERKA
jgi:hypothetical protein